MRLFLFCTSILFCAPDVHSQEDSIPGQDDSGKRYHLYTSPEIGAWYPLSTGYVGRGFPFEFAGVSIGIGNERWQWGFLVHYSNLFFPTQNPMQTGEFRQCAIYGMRKVSLGSRSKIGYGLALGVSSDSPLRQARLGFSRTMNPALDLNATLSYEPPPISGYVSKYERNFLMLSVGIVFHSNTKNFDSPSDSIAPEWRIGGGLGFRWMQVTNRYAGPYFASYYWWVDDLYENTFTNLTSLHPLVTASIQRNNGMAFRLWHSWNHTSAPDSYHKMSGTGFNIDRRSSRKKFREGNGFFLFLNYGLGAELRFNEYMVEKHFDFFEWDFWRTVQYSSRSQALLLNVCAGPGLRIGPCELSGRLNIPYFVKHNLRYDYTSIEGDYDGGPETLSVEAKHFHGWSGLPTWFRKNNGVNFDLTLIYMPFRL